MRIIALMLILASLAFSAPAPLQTIANDATMECSDFNAGDECFRCRVPEGWRILGDGMMECPEGYQRAEPELDCGPLRNAFCCSQGHSGGMGDCAGMLVNNAAKQCVFSEGSACTAPEGWSPADNGGMCPEGYGWLEEQPCAGGGQACAAPAAVLAAIMSLAFINLSKSKS